VDRKGKITLGIAAVAAVGALLAGVGPLLSSQENGPTTSPGNVNASGGAVAGAGGQNNGCVAIGNSSCVLTSPSPVDPNAADDATARGIYLNKAPSGRGPWPFTVLHDVVAGSHIGLWIRSSSERDGHHIGLAAHANPVWVDCIKTSSFNPEPGLSTGARWYKVHWPRTDPTDAPMSSSPSDPAQGWAYVYYLSPNGTDGKVPVCAGAS
jgi:hypothetical protein